MVRNPAEEGFLRAQEARTAALTRRGRKNEIYDFWSELKNDLKEWDKLLDALLTDSALSAGAASTRLEQLLQLLRDLRRKALSPSLEYPELPVADVRVLHNELTDRSQRLEEARDKLCPPDKFVFRRYRAAMHKRSIEKKTNRVNKAAVEPNDAKGLMPTPTTSPEPSVGRTIENHRKAIIVEDVAGKTTIQFESGQSIRLDVSGEADGSITLRDLHECQITLNAPYKALHISGLNQSTIEVTGNVEGAIHVTACHETVLRSRCHQLRLHESSKLSLFVSTRAGPILEDCQEIRFMVDPTDATTRDVKDFSWLRHGVPSPNFTVVDDAPLPTKEVTHVATETTSAGTVEGMRENVISATPAHNPTLSRASERRDNEECDDDDDDDDEDEL